MNASEVIRYIDTHCPPSSYRAEVVAWVRSWEGPKPESRLVTSKTDAEGNLVPAYPPNRRKCPHGNAVASCHICEDLRMGDVNTEG